MKKNFITMFTTWFRMTHWLYDDHFLEKSNDGLFRSSIAAFAFDAYKAGYNKAVRDAKKLKSI